jgi:hypothetical protein
MNTAKRTLYQQVLGGFVFQGTYLSRWCRENGIKRQNARKALLGEWNGPTAKVLRQRIVEASRGNMA